MMYIIFDTGVPSRLVWHIGEKIVLDRKDIEQITEVQADGDELLYIKHTFTNLPMHISRVVQSWYGDTAKFIVGNIKS